MKRLISVLLCLCLISALAACQPQATMESPITFYYPSSDLSYDADCTAIEAETREGASLETLEDILALYLQGPQDNRLKNPFPSNLQLRACSGYANTLNLNFSIHLSTLSGLDLTIACCCIAKTVFQFTEADSVCISADGGLLFGETSFTLTRESMILLDDATDTPHE